MLVIQQDKINKIVIDNNHNTDTGYTISIENDTSKRKITFVPITITGTSRYIQFTIEEVSDIRDEDLPNNILHLESGLNTITIYIDSKLIYTDILFVEFKDNLDTYEYDKNDDTAVFVYKK